MFEDSKLTSQNVTSLEDYDITIHERICLNILDKSDIFHGRLCGGSDFLVLSLI